MAGGESLVRRNRSRWAASPEWPRTTDGFEREVSVKIVSSHFNSEGRPIKLEAQHSRSSTTTAPPVQRLKSTCWWKARGWDFVLRVSECCNRTTALDICGVLCETHLSIYLTWLRRNWASYFQGLKAANWILWGRKRHVAFVPAFCSCASSESNEMFG